MTQISFEDVSAIQFVSEDEVNIDRTLSLDTVFVTVIAEVAAPYGDKFLELHFMFSDPSPGAPTTTSSRIAMAEASHLYAEVSVQ